MRRLLLVLFAVGCADGSDIAPCPVTDFGDELHVGTDAPVDTIEIDGECWQTDGIMVDAHEGACRMRMVMHRCTDD